MEGKPAHTRELLQTQRGLPLGGSSMAVTVTAGGRNPRLSEAMPPWASSWCHVQHQRKWPSGSMCVCACACARENPRRPEISSGILTQALSLSRQGLPINLGLIQLGSLVSEFQGCACFRIYLIYWATPPHLLLHGCRDRSSGSETWVASTLQMNLLPGPQKELCYDSPMSAMFFPTPEAPTPGSS